MAEWARIDVNFLRHPQVSRLKASDQLGYLSLILYAQEHETDGHIPASCLRWCDVKPAQVRAMVTAGLLTEDAEGWMIDGFLNHQRSRADMDAERDKARQRMQAARKAKSAPINGFEVAA